MAKQAWAPVDMNDRLKFSGKAFEQLQKQIDRDNKAFKKLG